MRPYIIISPRNLIPHPLYRQRSAGVRVLDKLSELLIAKGIETYIVNSDVPADDKVKELLTRDAIVVGHEFIKENYYSARTFVSYILGEWDIDQNNIPNTAVKFFYLLKFATDKYCVTAKEIWKLHLDIMDYSIFNTENIGERTLNICYRGKGQPAMLDALKLENKVYITNDYPKERIEVAELLKKAKYLWTCDACTCLASEARLCGTPVIFVPNFRFKERDLLRLCSNIGMASNMSGNEINRAEATISQFKEFHTKTYADQDHDLERFIKVTQEL